jgi:hypothetical protein
MTLFGNAGGGQWGEPPDSYINVLTVGEDWDEASLSWNNAPLAVENIGGTWVYPRDYDLPEPAYQWDISKAVHQAYSGGEPLRLALYSIDGEMHTGKYFWTSEVYDSNPEGIPTVTILLGDQEKDILNKEADSIYATLGTNVLYTISWEGTGEDQTMIDQLPIGLSTTPNNFQVNVGSASYDPGNHQIQWSGSPSPDQSVILTYEASVQTSGPKVLTNTASLTDTTGFISNDSVNLFVDPLQFYLPMISR